MTDPRENRNGAEGRADNGGDKNNTHFADETWRWGEIAPFVMEV
jgi:hypothetical protein